MRFITFFIVLAWLPSVGLAQLTVPHAERPDVHRYGWLSVKDFGATGNGLVDDTAAIQAAVDAAMAKPGTQLIFPKGTYLVGRVEIGAGLTLLGYGATLKKLPMQAEFTRTFTTFGQYLYSGLVDSPPLVIKGFVFDGNRLEQGPYTSSELEHQHSIFLMADSSQPGRLVVNIEDCYFHDGVADGVSIYTNCAVNISNCTAVDVFRGGVTVTGGLAEVHISNFTARGETHPTGIDVEVDGAGFGDSDRVDLTINGLILEGDFDVAIQEGSTAMISNVRSEHGPFVLYAPDSHVHLSNSRFRVGSNPASNRIIYPSDVTISNCVFVCEETDELEDDRELAAIRVAWEIGGSGLLENQHLRIIDCRFEVDGSVEDTDTTHAIYSGATQLNTNTRLDVRGCHIESGFDHGLWLERGGRVSMSDSYIDATNALTIRTSANRWLDASFSDLRFGPGVAVLETINIGNAENTIVHDLVVDEVHNTLATTGGIVGNVYRGRRVILVTDPPVSVPGIVGDVCRLKTPVEGQVYEWVCTASGVLAGTWRPLTQVSATP